MNSVLLAQAKQPQAGLGTLAALLLFILASVWIGLLANRAMEGKSFLKGFFLGNRGLGAWALALTATVQSGGTFMGFPSLVYTHGWTVALWIASYMVVPITGFAILAKRLAQLSRRTGAITVPDLFRARFHSAALGLTASLLIMLYMSAMMIAQFKAGAIVMKLSWPGAGQFALSEDFTDVKLPVDKLDKLKLPEDVRKVVAEFADRKFSSEKEFSAAIEAKLTPDQWKTHQAKIRAAARPIDWLYLFGLAIFTLTVVGYTVMGGFLAAVWTDLFQSVMMFIGVVLLFVCVMSQSGGLQESTLDAFRQNGAGYVYGPGFDPPAVPGYSPDQPREFLPLGLAFSFFGLWVLTGVGSPAGMVRVMACKNAGTIRRAIYLLSVYNIFIYIPLILICICGRSLIPDLGSNSDEIIPRLALMSTAKLPLGSFLAGLVLAAPFGAIMATVSSYLVVIASGVVRDVYQRFIRPHASEGELRWLSHTVMVVIGLMAVIANLQPVQFLQAIVVFSGSGAAATFTVPALMLCYWRRATTPGVFCSMIMGAGTVLSLYLLGILGITPHQSIGQLTGFKPYYFLGIDPLVWGFLNSLVAGTVVSYLTRPPAPEIVSGLFDARPAPAADG